jgi:hypothetical protein
MEEKAVMGWKAFSELTGMSERKALMKRQELLDCGAIFYLRRGRKHRRCMMFFPSIVKRWCGVMGSKRLVI